MTEPDDPTPALKWSDLFGIDPDYTDGVPADDWLEANRGLLVVNPADPAVPIYPEEGTHR